MSVVVPLKGVEETGDRHKLALHRSIDGVLDSLGTVQTVDLGLILNTDAVVGYGDGVALGFCSHDTGSLRTTFILVFLLFFLRGAFFFLTAFLLGLPSLLVLLGFLSKGTGLQLSLGHLHFPIKTDVIAVSEVDMLMIVAVPVLF